MSSSETLNNQPGSRHTAESLKELNTIAQGKKTIHEGEHVTLPLAIPNLHPVAFEEVSCGDRNVPKTTRSLIEEFLQGVLLIFTVALLV